MSCFYLLLTLNVSAQPVREALNWNIPDVKTHQIDVEERRGEEKRGGEEEGSEEEKKIMGRSKSRRVRNSLLGQFIQWTEESQMP